MQHRPVSLFGEAIQWVATTRYLGRDTRLNWSPHIYQARERTSQSMGMLVPLLNRKRDLSVRNRVLLYNQLIRPMMYYACPALRSAVRTYVWRLQVLRSKCLCLATGASWNASIGQIHEDLGVLFAIRALTASFDLKLAEVGNPLVRQLGRYADRGLTQSPDAKVKGSRGQSRPSPALLNSTKRIAFGAEQPSAFRLP
jgi:hypothetical protein